MHPHEKLFTSFMLFSGKRRTHLLYSVSEAQTCCVSISVKINTHSELINRDKPIAHRSADIHPSKSPVSQRLRVLRNAVERKAECAFQ